MEKVKYLSIFFENLTKHDIRYSVLRNYLQLPKSTGGSDLDILIHQDDIRKFVSFLNTYIQSNSLKLVSYLPDNKCPKLCIINDDFGLQIDAFLGGVFFGKRELIESKFLFNNTFVYNDIYVLNPKAGSLLSFLKEILNNKNCDKKYIESLKSQYSNNSIEIELLNQFSPKFSQFLNQHLTHLDNSHISILYKIASKNFKKNKFSNLKNKIIRLKNKPGYTIAFLGTDGSGKSTLIETITPVLNDAFHNAVYYEHMRPNKLPSIARLMGKKENFNGPTTNPHDSKPSGFIGSLVRWSYYMLDYTIGYAVKVFPKKAIRSCVWIFDRYYYDYLIDPKRSRVKLPTWILKFGQFIIPEPDIIICLGTNPEIIHNRKPELPLDEVEKQVAALKLFCQNNKRAFWIDTGVSIDESSKEALNVIIAVMAKRFESVKLN